MNKLKTLALAALMVGALAPAFAADTSATIVARRAPQPVGVSPVVGYVHAAATAAAASANAFTFDVPAPRGTANIVGVQAMATSVSGTTKILRFSRSGRTVSVAGTTSDTIATGDVVRAIVIYNP